MASSTPLPAAPTLHGFGSLDRGRPRAVRSPNRRLRNCMLLEYDAAAGLWRDALRVDPAQRLPIPPPRSRAPLPAVTQSAPARWDDPLVLGLLLCVAPPVGVLALWASTRIPHAGKVAATVFAGLCVAAVALVAAAGLVSR